MLLIYLIVNYLCRKYGVPLHNFFENLTRGISHLNEPICSLFIIFPYYSDDLFNYLNKLFADYRHPFVHVYTA